MSNFCCHSRARNRLAQIDDFVSDSNGLRLIEAPVTTAWMPGSECSGGRSRFGDENRPPEPNSPLCVGLEGETGDFKCLTLSALSPAQSGAFL